MRSSMRLVCLSVVAVGAVGAACTSGGEKPSSGASGPPVAGADTGGGGTEVVATAHYTGNPEDARQGRGAYIRYNCYACHGGLGGGAMGPSLRDTVWKYGGTDTLIYMSIAQGRPLGMPTWSGIIPPAQIHQLVDYIKSLRTDAEPKFFFIQIDSSGKVTIPAGNSVTSTVQANAQ